MRHQGRKGTQVRALDRQTTMERLPCRRRRGGSLRRISRGVLREETLLRVARDVTSRRNCVQSCAALSLLRSFPLNTSIAVCLTVVHDPRVYRLKVEHYCTVLRAFPNSTWDSHHSAVINWAPILCSITIIVIIIVDDVSWLACLDTLLAPSAHLHMWCSPAAVGRRVAALLWHGGRSRKGTSMLVHDFQSHPALRAN